MNDDTHPYSWSDRVAACGLSDAVGMAGYYNDNYRIAHGGRFYLLRKPIPNSDVMDLRRIDEAPVLRALERVGFDAPRLLYQPASGAFSLHGWIEGETLNDIYPDQVRVPGWIPANIAQQMAVLHAIDPAPFAETCADLGSSPDAADFFRAHWRFDRSVYERLLPEMVGTYRALGIPDDPFVGLDRLATGITPRPFCLCHSDIHRKNILIRAADENLTLLDWELVLVGDPVYDLGVHFHKMRYAPDQEVCFVEAYVAAAPLRLTVSAVRAEIDLYLQLERVKSAIIDACRVRGDLRSGKVRGEGAKREAARYARKLDKARAVWSQGGARTICDPEWVRDVLMG